jgi:hypothetical protein
MCNVETSAIKSISVGVYARAINDSLPLRGERWSLPAVIFGLARRVKDDDPNADEATLDAIANEWYAGAEWAMGETDVADVRALLKNGYAKARRGFTEPTRQKEAIAREYERLKREPLSETAKRFRNPINRELVRVVEAAQRANPGGDFELGESFAAKLVGCSQPRAGRGFDTLEEAGVIEMTAERVKNKVARRWRLVAAVKTFAERIAEKVRETLSAVGKLAAGMVERITATSATSEPAEPQAEPGEPTERPWWEADPNQPPYVPPAVPESSGAGRERNGPRPRPAGGWRFRSWREVVFGMCRPRPRPEPAKSSEPEVV